MVASQGEVLVQRVMAGMMFTFPRDCLADASGVLLVMFELMPEQVATWVRGTIAMLPAGTVKVGDADRLVNAIAQKIQVGDMRKIRVLLQGTSSCCRVNAPRCLGRVVSADAFLAARFYELVSETECGATGWVGTPGSYQVSLQWVDCICRVGSGVADLAAVSHIGILSLWLRPNAS